MEKSQNKKNGLLVRDFSNPEDAKAVANMLGGEENLKSKYPNVHKAFLKTVEEHTKIRNAGNSVGDVNSLGLSSGAFTSTVAVVPYTKNSNKMLRSSGNNDSDERVDGMLQCSSIVQGNYPWNAAHVNGVIKDKTAGTVIHSYGKILKNKNHDDVFQSIDTKDINIYGDQTLNHTIECKALKEDGTLEVLNSHNNDFIIKGTSAPVVYMNLDDPKSKIGNDPIVVLYGRAPAGNETADYSYPDNTALPPSGDTVNTILPIKGQITFSDDIVPVEYGADVTSQVPQLQLEGKGICKYNHTQEEIAKCFSISASNPQVVEFDLTPDWKRILDITAYKGHDHQVDINFLFSFYYKVKIMGAIEDYQSITIRSATKADLGGKSYYESNNEPNVYLPKLHIRWGCFAKDTMIKKADNSTVAVSDLNIGDELISINGKTVKIKDIVKGKEESIHIITTKSGKKIKVTNGHPLLTSEGPVNSSDIRPNMELLCEDGRDVVEFVYTEPYGDMTYNIVTDNGSDWLSANGLWAGNYDCQNENMVLKESDKEFSKDHTKLIDEFNNLMVELHG